MDIDGYLGTIRPLWLSGQATEHSYRPALERLFAAIDPALTVINEPKRSEGGMPDFLFQRNAISIGWAEAKDIDTDVIRLKGYSVEQRERYEAAYPNLLYTNGVDFEFIREGEPVSGVAFCLQPQLASIDAPPLGAPRHGRHHADPSRLHHRRRRTRSRATGQ